MIPGILLSLVLPAAASPTPAQDEFVGFQRKALGLYFAETLSELKSAREQLEFLQEFDLNPHDADVPVVSALRRLDRAEALLHTASGTLSELVGAFPPSAAELEGWSPIEDRIAKALALIDRSTVAAEVSRLYRTSLPVEVYPSPGPSLAFYSSKLKLVRLRGYYGVNKVAPEFLAAVLVHEGQHAVQDRRGKALKRKFKADLEGEREARELEVRFWKELGASSADDFLDTEGEQLAEYEHGRSAFDAYVRDHFHQSPFWEWAEPAVAKPGRPFGPPKGELKAMAEELAIKELDSEKAAQTMHEIQDNETGIRHNTTLAALKRMENARERLKQLPEILAPYPRIVNHSTMSMRAEQLDAYPLLMRLGYGVLAAVMDELDAARIAMSEKRAGGAALERLRKEQDWAEPEGPLENLALNGRILQKLKASKSAASLAVLWEQKGLRIGLVPWMDPHLEASHPDRLLLPGRLYLRKPDDSLGAAWAVHLLVHRRQGLAPGAAPSLDQELEAWTETGKFWQGLGAVDLDGYSGTHGHRLLVMSAVWESGGAGLARLYLQSKLAPSKRKRH